jgi:hypothetical protein
MTSPALDEVNGQKDGLALRIYADLQALEWHQIIVGCVLRH